MCHVADLTGRAEIVDGNLKMALGLIWTIILRFQIQDISMEELSAKEALLLWCQRKTEGYKDVSVQNFHMSFQDGLAFCAIIHKHRPDLLDFNALNKNNKEENLNLAFDIAEKLGIPKLLDAKDIVDVQKPDERSIITYVSLYYHYFNQNRQTDIAGRRIGKLVDFTEASERAMADYAGRATALKAWIEQKQGEFQAPQFPNSLEGVQEKMTAFKTYKEAEKSAKADDKVGLEALYNALQTKLAVNHRQPYVPPAGLSPADIGEAWTQLEKGEHDYSLAMLAEFRRLKRIKDLLRRFNVKLQNLENWISENSAALANADIGDTLAAVSARLKNHEAFEEESKAQSARHDALKAIYAELQAQNFGELASLDARLATKDQHWAALEAAAHQRKEALLAEQARQKTIEDLLHDYAKRALQFRVWANDSEEMLSDPITVETIQAVDELTAELDAFVSGENANKYTEVQALSEIVGQLQGYEKSETVYSQLSLADIHKMWEVTQNLIEQRRAALEEERKRQEQHEVLRVDFAAKAKALHEYVAQQQAAINGLTGSFEEQSQQVQEIGNAFQGSKAQYDELVALTREMEARGITENAHTELTIESLRAEWNAISVLATEKAKALDRELGGQRDSRLSPEQVQEYRECFQHFDKDRDSQLSRIELFGCMRACGYEYPLEENGALDTLLAQIGTNGLVAFEQFLKHMENLNADVDTPDQINEVRPAATWTPTQ